MAFSRAARRSGFVVRGGRQVRETLWTSVDFSLNSQSALGGVITNAANAALLALRPFTVIRFRGVLFLRSDQTAAAEAQAGAFGAAVVTEQALAIGVTAVPTPVTDMGSDEFFMHQIIMAGESRLTDVAIPGTFLQFDSKAMRKCSESEEPYFVYEFASTTQGAQLHSAGRLLLKLH